MFRLATVLASVAALFGCHHDTRLDDQRTASGQVLAGSISDAMIPYEQLQSRPPLAPRVVDKAKGKAGTADSADSAAGDDAASDAAPAPAPAAEASPPIRY